MDSSLYPILMFAVLFLGLAAGIHIAFVLALVPLSFALFLWGVQGMMTYVQGAWGAMNNFALTAIPLFIFMAALLEKSGIVQDLYLCFYKWSGPLRGGLAVATVVVGAIVGAVSGVVAAGVIGLGLIALPRMEHYKYDRGINMGSVLVAGTLGQLIPPSLVMVIYGAVTNLSVGKLFAAGVSAGILLTILFCTYILIRAWINPALAPALPKDQRATWREKFLSLKAVILPVLLIISCMGAIFSGAATPTEGAAFGALGAILFAAVTRRLSWKILQETCIVTLRVTNMVAWMIAGAVAFSAVFSGIGGNRVVMDFAQAMPAGKYGVLVLSILFVFFLGCFLETTAIILLAAPIVTPMLIHLGFDPLWWGTIFMVLLQTAYITPPFGMSLFYLKGVTHPDITLEDIFRATPIWIGLQCIGITLIVFFPSLGLWAAHYFYGE
jgi:tripartite ATP-independent transporter DctM subunit